MSDFRRPWTKTRMLDTLHKSTIGVLATVTVAGVGYIGYLAYLLACMDNLRKLYFNN